ncbi:MAG: acetate--CoA ligase family protein [Spirochaetota bacterium]|nr:MAG: acetate--CoA ligase family protein [Spirochaetota bacterium]
MKRSVLDSIERTIKTAHNENRYTLFEHEVYEILANLGVRTPTHIFIRDEKDITSDTLSLFSSDKIVLKVAAKGITHKQKSGGVKIVYKDLDFVKHSFRKMQTMIESNGTEVAGIHLVEYIEYSKDLGNETLLGFRESEAFGPVISFSKGGTDAEHFAENFSAPNLILAPIDRQWARALLESTKIQKKYIAEGKTDYIAKIVNTGVVFSDLSINFSNFFPGKSKYVLKEFEVNPFIFDFQGNFIAIDGFARFELKADEKPDLNVLPKQTLTPIFEPKSIAVIGISANDNTKSGNIIVKNLMNMNWEKIYCVNIKGGNVVIAKKRFKLYRSIVDIEKPIDLAIVTVPAESTISIVEDCAKKKVKAIILISGGFSEIRKNQEIERKIHDICKKNGIRVMGPNCLGIVYAGNEKSIGMNTFFIPEEKFSVNLEKKDRNVAILSQSGALGITEIYNLRNAIAPKVIVSYGNQLDIDPSDLANYFEDDPSIDVIGFYIEGFKNGAGRKFFNITQKSTKPIIVYKAGRTEAGKLAAQSHTASISGEYAICKAAMKQAGLVVADTMLDHGDFIKTFALLHDFNVNGNKVAIITNAGYEKTYAADNIGNLEIATLDKETKQKLKKILPSFVNADSLLDLTAMASDELFERCIEILLSSNNTDALFISIVPQAQVIHTTDEEIDKYKMNIAARIIDIVHKFKKPTVVSINVVTGADAVYNKLGQVLDRGRVPTFLTAERAMICLNEFIKYRTTKDSKAYSEWLRE